ncbi:MAG: phage integrase N-terminal SAM-like domain-containing protein [Chloroflexota bacterium]
MNEDEQTPLIPESALPPAAPKARPPLSADASLQATLGLFGQYMEEEGFSENTRKAFISDVRLLGKFLGIGQPIGEIGTQNLNDFLNWLLFERGVPCRPKSYSRRVTTLKVFFGWLYETGVLYFDPSSAVVQSSVSSPLPTLPTEDEITQSLAITAGWRQKGDARPHLLLTLLLDTGVKKGEAMAMVPNHVDRSDPDGPFLYIRYKNPRLRYKERKISLDPAWLEVFDEYLRQYRPPDTVFTCTARNLEYILHDVAETAGLPDGRLSFENLRWVSALRDLRGGVEPDHIRERLGLSRISWRETKAKLFRLTDAEKLP